ncbi:MULTISPECIES: protoglobin domain-containing protein [Thermus]|jgi:hypothetical protein|uniref:Globin-sensor domain-containing protein n=1 Tax=Thermus brockianus TaxID=56956 RepID=A0A1J0LVQ3_THEBO|nr:hypothetical protein [Thermus brockianus]APD10438.1 hypothetical protein A0O31_02413 [Thermus brockianus]
MIKNLFALTPEERAAYLRQMAELMGVLSDWELLASVREQVEPYFPVVAGRIAERLRHHPLTQQIQDVTQALTAIAQVYFARPTLDAEYLERRARAGRAYLEAGFSTGTLVAGIYGLWVDEWTRVFSELFHEDPGLLARLNRALALVSLYNLAIVAQQYTYESELQARELEERLLAKFLKATGISRELYEQMAKTAGEE